MALSSGPWDSVNGDRKLAAGNLQAMFAMMIKDGVRDPATDFPLTITAAASSAIRIGGGMCVIGGTFARSESAATYAANLPKTTKDTYKDIWGGLIYAYRDTRSRSIQIAYRVATSAAEPTCGEDEIPLYKFAYYRTSSVLLDNQIVNIMVAAGPRNESRTISLDHKSTISGLIKGVDGYTAPAVPDVDYATIEMGEFTPYLQGTGWTYQARSGRYAKIGGMVLFSLGLQTGSKPSTAEALKVVGLPYASRKNARQGVNVAYAEGCNAIVTATILNKFGVATIEVYKQQTIEAITSDTIENVTTLNISGHYIIDQGGTDDAD